MKNRYFMIPADLSESFWDGAGINLQYHFVVPTITEKRYIPFYISRLAKRWCDDNSCLNGDYTQVIFTEGHSRYEKRQEYKNFLSLYSIGIFDTLVECEFKEQVMWAMMAEGAIQLPSPVHHFLRNHPNYHAQVR